MFGKKKEKPGFTLSLEADTFLASAISEHNEKNKVLIKDWGFDNYKEWGFDQDSRVFFLKLKSGETVEADGQIYGSWSKRDSTWEWAWNNPHAEKDAAKDSHTIREYGEAEKLEYLVQGVIPCPDVVYATYLASIGEKICSAQGVFPGKAGSFVIFIGLHNLRKQSQ